MRSDDLAHLLTLDLTHVQYSARDPWGAYWALVTLSPTFDWRTSFTPVMR